MDSLNLEQTKNTPTVNCDPDTGIMEIKGSSYPENTSEFYGQIVDWINQYMLNVTGELTLNFDLDYLNSSSIKFVSDIIEKLETYFKGGGEVKINWYHEEDDEDIQEMGEELKEDTKIPFNIFTK